MDFFNYKNNTLFAENVAIEDIAGAVGTPTYVYSKATFLDHLHKMQAAFSDIDTTICFSIKACSNINILRFLAEAGSGFDIVSGGELYRAKKAGADTSKIVFAGVGKNDAEIIEAMKAGIGYFNIESEAELSNLVKLAAEYKDDIPRKPKAALRVNPDVDYRTHKYITTGKKETKFGVDIEKGIEVFKAFGNNQYVDLCAVHVHLGSGGKTIDPYVDAVEKILPVIDEIRQLGFRVEALDLGGGYAAAYTDESVPSAAEYASGIVKLLKDKNLKLILEPGKSICGNAGILLTKVLYLKQGGEKKFVIVDAGMNDLIRPPLYDAFHFIWPAKVEDSFIPTQRAEQLEIGGLHAVDIVGPICEGADFFAKQRNFPPVEKGDVISIFTAGAYCFTMSSNYNARPRAAEVLVDGNDFKVIRRRETYSDLTAAEEL
jgi:diaminopimelate decarboxylase